MGLEMLLPRGQDLKDKQRYMCSLGLQSKKTFVNLSFYSDFLGYKTTLGFWSSSSN